MEKLNNKKDCKNCIHLKPVKKQPGWVSCAHMLSCHMNNKNKFEQKHEDTGTNR